MLATAYEALFQVAGLPPSEWPDRMAAREPMKREDVDWMKVARLRAKVEAEARARGRAGGG